MLSCSVRASWHRFPFAPPGRSRRQEGVLLQGHPRPWPVAKPRTLRVPAHKVLLRGCVVLVRRWYTAGKVGAGLGTLPPPALPLWTKKLSTSAALPWATSLSSLPCWVVPPSKASSPAGGPARFCCLHSKVRQLAALACLGLMTPAAPGEPAPALRRCDFYSWGSACSRGRLCPAWALVRAHSFGPFRPRPRRPSAFPQRRSLPLLQGA